MGPLHLLQRTVKEKVGNLRTARAETAVVSGYTGGYSVGRSMCWVGELSGVVLTARWCWMLKTAFSAPWHILERHSRSIAPGLTTAPPIDARTTILPTRRAHTLSVCASTVRVLPPIYKLFLRCTPSPFPQRLSAPPTASNVVHLPSLRSRYSTLPIASCRAVLVWGLAASLLRGRCSPFPQTQLARSAVLD